uniref:WD repeat domain 18 n=1 Tax=Eptatretus burgeri TaxID=7764 RepID=A0A8C4QXP5_EPTBU
PWRLVLPLVFSPPPPPALSGLCPYPTIPYYTHLSSNTYLVTFLKSSFPAHRSQLFLHSFPPVFAIIFCNPPALLFHLIFKTTSGGLLEVLCRHYQNILCLSFADDGGHFVSGGQDNLAIVWSLAGVLRNGEPKHVWNQHTLPVTDVCCGVGGVKARVATASLDQTAKLWELGSGLLLFSVVLGMPVTAVALDPAEYWLFCGTSTGTISVVPLHTAKREQIVQIDAEEKNCLQIHKAEVTCMAVTMDGGTLVSGSADGTVCLWDIDSGQCIHTIPHKGPVNALLLVSRLQGVLVNAEARPSLPLPRFSRQPRTAEAGGGTDFFIAPEEQPPPGYLDHLKNWTTVVHDAIRKVIMEDVLALS